MTYVDLNLRLPELLLMRVDKMSMGVWLEGRVPFLDHKFVEDVLSLPTAIRLTGDQPKALLRRPSATCSRTRSSTGPSRVSACRYGSSSWTGSATSPAASSEDFCAQTDLLDVDEVGRHLDGDKGWPSWYLLNLALWWKAYIR